MMLHINKMSSEAGQNYLFFLTVKPQVQEHLLIYLCFNVRLEKHGI